MSKIKQSPALLSPPDDKDYVASAAMEFLNIDLPADFSVWQPPVEDQGQTGNCVAQALSNIFECIEHQRTQNHQEYSVGYIYGSKLNTVPGAGMYIREACKIALKEGDVYRMLWECFDENPWCKEKRLLVSDYIQQSAKRIGMYVRLYTKEEVKAFIYKYRLPVLISAPVGAYKGGSGDGYHSTVVYGWESEESFRKREGWNGQQYKEMLYTNSWGNHWTDPDGRDNILFNDIREIWGIVPMETKQLTDIQNHWAKKDIEECVELGVIKGYEDNSFKPNQPITRAEVAVIAARLSRLMKASDENLSERVKKLENMFGINTGN